MRLFLRIAARAGPKGGLGENQTRSRAGRRRVCCTAIHVFLLVATRFSLLNSSSRSRAERHPFVLLCRFIVHKEIDLTNPDLGSELLKDPKGDFPLDVWEAYCTAPSTLSLLRVLPWRKDPSDPRTAALDPQQAVDEAFNWLAEAVFLLRRTQPRPAKALEAAEQALQILTRAG